MRGLDDFDALAWNRGLSRFLAISPRSVANASAEPEETIF